ncbi:MAG: hypothetical protein K2X86_18380 [Cytophagaceae bacterium]|nr:hypothetical protein [Cytophagaceae bacterium]
MKPLHILIWIISLGIITSINAQSTANTMMEGTADSTTTANLDEDAGYSATIFTTGGKNSSPGGCSLIQNHWRDRKVYRYKNGYKIVTSQEDETVEVKTKDAGGRKIKYSNDYETLKYHLKKDGTVHYKYSYWNECKKVNLRRSKKGITSLTNKSGLEQKDVRNNVRSAIQKGVNSCSNVQ